MPRRLEQPLTNDNFLNKVLRRSRERSETLGDLCRYEITGVEIAPDELFDRLDKLGLEKWNPVPIRKKTAARKAITRIKRTLEDPENDLKIIVRRVPTDEPDLVRYAMVDETVDHKRLDLDYHTRNQVIFRTDKGTMEFTQEVNNELLEMFDYLCSVYTDREVSRLVHNIVDTHGCVWLRDNSGMFFMPHPLKDVVDSLLQLFEFFREYTDKTCYFRPIAIMNDAQNRATMGEALIADISLELSDATEALDKAIEEESQRPLTAALRRFKIAKGKAAMYKDMLNMNMTGIDTQLADADKKAADLMQTLMKKKAEKNG